MNTFKKFLFVFYILVASVFVICISVPLFATQRYTIWPNSPITGPTQSNLDLNGNYEFESSDYFEITDTQTIESVLTKTEGNPQGIYKISAHLQGRWILSNSATISSPDEGTLISITPNTAASVALLIVIVLILICLGCLFV